MSFDDWLKELDAEAERLANVKNLSTKTGRDCWRTYFDDDYSPADALVEDWSYG